MYERLVLWYALDTKSLPSLPVLSLYDPARMGKGHAAEAAKLDMCSDA